MKKWLFFLLILALAAVWWVKRHRTPATNNAPELIRPMNLNEKVRRLPPHLQRKVQSALDEAGKFESGATARGSHFSEPGSRDHKAPIANRALPAYSPEIQRKLDRLPPATRRKVEQSIFEARQNPSQP